MAIYNSKLNRSKLFLCQIGILIFYICTLATNLAKSQRHLPMHLACILVCTMFLHLHFHQQKIIFFLNLMISWSKISIQLPLSIVHSTDCTPVSAGTTQLDVSSQDPIGTLHLHSSPTLQLHVDGVPLKLSKVFRLSHWLLYQPMRIQMKPGLVIGPCKRFDTVQYFVFVFSFFSSEIFFLNLVFSCSSLCLQVDPKTHFVFRLYFLFHLQGHLRQSLLRILVLNFEATSKLFLRAMIIGSFGATLGHYRIYFEKSSDNTLQSIRRFCVG